MHLGDEAKPMSDIAVDLGDEVKHVSEIDVDLDDEVKPAVEIIAEFVPTKNPRRRRESVVASYGHPYGVTF